MPKKRLFQIFCAGLISTPVSSAPILDNYNGHYYEVISPNNGITWNEAYIGANNLTYSGLQGHLATITSQQEFDWITSNLDYEGTFLGGTDQNSEGTWQWITGETFNFTAWEPGEPNSWHGYNEDYLMFWWKNNNPVAGWNDTVNDPFSIPGAWFDLGYIVEYDGVPISGDPVSIPAPATLSLLGTAFLSFFTLRRRNLKRK